MIADNPYRQSISCTAPEWEGKTAIKIIISPAKNMKEEDTLPPLTRPLFLDRAATLLTHLRSLSLPALKALLSCNDKLAGRSFEHFQGMDLSLPGSPALLCYDGIQYKYMAPQVFEANQFAYVQEHLRIVSGFYGLLRPFDGILPYRLEMRAKLNFPFCKSLYDYWGDALARAVEKEDWILNLASWEYARAVLPFLPSGLPVITCLFGQLENGKIREKGVCVKMARGEMVRYLAKGGIKAPEGLMGFSALGFAYSQAHSDTKTFVFIKQGSPKT